MPPPPSQESADASRDVLESWHVAPSSNRDYHFLDGLRGIAILMVIGCHFVYVNPQAGSLVRFVGSLFSAGALGVPLFFSLSGFLISWPFWKAKIRPGRRVLPKGYGWRRFYKIYPPIAFSFLFLIPFYIWQTGDASYLTVALEWLVGWPLVSPIKGEVNPVMWSLAIEVQFYIVLPLVMLACRRLSPRTCLWLVPTLFFAAGLGRRCLQAAGWIASYPFPAVIDSRFPAGLDYFAFGILVSGLHAAGKITRREAPWAWLGVAAYSSWWSDRPSSVSRPILLLSGENWSPWGPRFRVPRCFSALETRPGSCPGCCPMPACAGAASSAMSGICGTSP
jgi:peptidoglycan/LPS O-acetylase OafA/YrhL